MQFAEFLFEKILNFVRFRNFQVKESFSVQVSLYNVCKPPFECQGVYEVSLEQHFTRY